MLISALYIIEPNLLFTTESLTAHISLPTLRIFQRGAGNWLKRAIPERRIAMETKFVLIVRVGARVSVAQMGKPGYEKVVAFLPLLYAKLATSCCLGGCNDPRAQDILEIFRGIEMRLLRHMQQAFTNANRAEAYITPKSNCLWDVDIYLHFFRGDREVAEAVVVTMRLEDGSVGDAHLASECFR